MEECFFLGGGGGSCWREDSVKSSDKFGSLCFWNLYVLNAKRRE